MAKSILVSMPDFTIAIRENGETIRVVTDCCFGRPGNQTPALAGGHLSTWKRDADHKSGSYPPPDGGAPMPYALFLEEYLTVAFHQGDPFAESHGCIHLNAVDAPWVFAWAGSAPVAVDIVGPHPTPGVRARVYRVGAGNMLPRVIQAVRAVLAAEGLLAASGAAVYDAAAAAAVSAYQVAHGLSVDGKVGPETALRMGIRL